MKKPSDIFQMLSRSIKYKSCYQVFPTYVSLAIGSVDMPPSHHPSTMSLQDSRL